MLFNLDQAIVNGGPAVITMLIAFIITSWTALTTGVVRFGRECDYRDMIIVNQVRTIDELRNANNALIEANRQQAQNAQTSLDFIRQELFPRITPARPG